MPSENEENMGRKKLLKGDQMEFQERLLEVTRGYYSCTSHTLKERKQKSNALYLTKV